MLHERGQSFRIPVNFTDIDIDTGIATDTETETDTATGTEKETKKEKSFLKKTDTEKAKGKATATDTGTVKEKAAPGSKIAPFVKYREAAGFGCFHCSGEDIGFQTGFFRFLLGVDQTFVSKHHISLLDILGCLCHRTKQMEVEVSVISVTAQCYHLKLILRVYPLK